MCGGFNPLDALDKLDNWTEGAGDILADIDPGPAIGDAFASFDKEVLQKVDPATVASVAAIATGNAYLVPYITAANTAAKGGDIQDIATSFAISYAATEFAPVISKEVSAAVGPTVGEAAGKVIGSTVQGATVGAGAGGAQAAASDKSIFEGATRGATIGAVTGAVSSSVSQGYNAAKNEFGIGTSYSPNAAQDAQFAAAQAESLRAQGIGEQQIEQTLRLEGVQPQVAADVAGLTSSGIGEKAVAQNIESSYSAKEMYNPPPVVDTSLERAGKKIVSDTISKSILGEILPTDMDPASFTLRFRSRYSPQDTSVEDLTGTGNVALTSVLPSKYDLKRFVNDAGQSTMISFKDDQPLSPIPPGYKEVETIGAAEGGLIDSSNTTMVKYSKKPLLAPRKKVTKPKEKKIASKGLASKK